MPPWMTRVHKDTSGNVAMIFAICLVPIFALIAFSIDLNTTSSNKTRLQALTDSAAVSGARSRLQGIRGTELRKDLIGFIESQTDPMPGIACQTPVVIDAWWVHEVIVKMNCRNGAEAPSENGAQDRTFEVQSIGYYTPDAKVSGPAIR